MTNFSRLFTDPNQPPPISMYLCIPEIPKAALSSNQRILQFAQQRCIKVPPVICHTTLYLFQTWAGTRYGKLALESTSKPRHNQVDIFLEFGEKYRHSLNKTDLEDIQTAYEHMSWLMAYKLYHS